MRLNQAGGAGQRTKIVKGLLIAATVTLLCSFALGLWSSMTDRYSVVLDFDEISLMQLDPAPSGSPAAIVHTSMGDMQFTLYPEQCPQTVKNFCNLAESGYYDGTYVFELAPSVFFAAGAASPDGALPANQADTPQERVPQETSPKLWPFRGALCAMQTKTEGGFWKILTKTQETFTGSRFLVCNSIEMTKDIKKGLEDVQNEALHEVGQVFLERGGIPNYAQQLTVFGQMTEGFEVLDAITSVEVTGEQDATRPKENITIDSVEIISLP